MKRKLIINWKEVSKKEMFLYLLQARLLHFFEVDDREVIQFTKFCVDHGLLKYRQTKEYRGTPAEFDVLKDFNIQWKPTGFGGNRPTYVLCKGDGLVITEMMYPSAKRDNNWVVEADVPTGENRRKFYEWAKELLCK